MSQERLRKSSRKNAGRAPERYSPSNTQLVNSEVRSSTSSQSSRKLKEIELKKLEEINELKTRMEKMELEKKLEQERREMERKISLIEARASLEEEKVLEESSQISKHSSKFSVQSEDSLIKVTSWLENQEDQISTKNINNEAEQDINKIFMNEFSPAMKAMTTAINLMSKQNFEKSMSRSSYHELPIFSGKVDEWPMFISLFRKTSEMGHLSDEENIMRLQKSLKNEAFDSVKYLFISPKNLNTILEILEARFGRSDIIIETLINKASALEKVEEDNPLSLVQFSNCIQNLTATATSLDMDVYIMNPQLISKILYKLPMAFQYHWAREISRRNIKVPTLVDFAEWLQEEAKLALLLHKPMEDKDKPKKQKHAVFVTSGSEPPNKLNCSYCQETNHKIYKCKKFLELTVLKRWEWIKKNKKCFYCLNSSHRVWKCKLRKVCGKQDCQKFHNKLLHVYESQQTTQQNTSTSENHTLHVGNEFKTVLLRVLPIKLYGTKKEIETYALFDEGSTVSLIDAKLAEEIGVDGVEDPLKMFWTNSSCYEDNFSKRVNFKIQGNLNEELFDLNDVRTVKNLNLPYQSVNVKHLSKKWKYLSNIHMENLENAKPKLLIGQNHINLTIAREVIEGPGNAPIASKTKLGWVLHGNLPYFKNRVDSEFTFCNVVNQELEEMIKECIYQDNLGMENPSVKRFSNEDKRALEIMEKTCHQRSDGHWEIGLLWKKENNQLPESQSSAFRRLKTVERKMDADPKFAKTYCDQIEEFINKGYAKILDVEELEIPSENIWFLPHFAVKHQNKPEMSR